MPQIPKEELRTETLDAEGNSTSVVLTHATDEVREDDIKQEGSSGISPNLISDSYANSKLRFEYNSDPSSNLTQPPRDLSNSAEVDCSNYNRRLLRTAFPQPIPWSKP